ncbi:MAG: DUF1684 domain-containing protein [Gammaproteobacteria bacterium]|nr:DUF1684 domain-containing protein [Gammaproteobacteria bacterium]MCY3939717.1 DUF1684 domain-containing protein [Gammaproteobacteria bacterium]
MKQFVLCTLLSSAWFMVAGAAPQPAESPGAADYVQSIADWRAEREEELKGPDGWLNLAGLYWLEPGATSMGAAPDNDIVLSDLPAAPYVGAFVWENGIVEFRADPGAEVVSNGERVTQLRLVHDEEGDPTVLTHGSVSWHAIGRLDRMGVRLRDLNHPAVSAFPGIPAYPTDSAWRVEARFEPYARPEERILTTVVEGLGWKPTAPGVLAFELGGEPLSLEAYAAGPGFLLIFADLTTGKTTYPAGRYLYAFASRRAGGTVTLDFNKAINPPCAFTDFATCPLPQRRNRLPIAIEAGEQYAKGNP